MCRDVRDLAGLKGRWWFGAAWRGIAGGARDDTSVVVPAGGADRDGTAVGEPESWRHACGVGGLDPMQQGAGEVAGPVALGWRPVGCGHEVVFLRWLVMGHSGSGGVGVARRPAVSVLPGRVIRGA